MASAHDQIRKEIGSLVKEGQRILLLETARAVLDADPEVKVQESVTKALKTFTLSEEYHASGGQRVQGASTSQTGRAFLGEVTARGASRFVRGDWVLRRLVKEPRVVAQARLRGVPELLGDVDDVLALLDEQRGEGATQVVRPGRA